MSNPHLVLCGHARLTARTREWLAVEPLRLHIGRGPHDVHLRLDHLTEKLCASLPAVVTDLLELAAFVYAADQASTRGGTRQFEYGHRWRRRFRFEVPVRCPEVWRARPVYEALTGTLGFFSDDDYEFAFSQLRNPTPMGRYLFDGQPSAEAHDFEEVNLFSGGLDSLGGAVQEILQGQRKVVLVSHRPADQMFARQRALIDAIEARLPGGRPKPLHVAVEVNKGRALDAETTQRTRSFLFGAIAAVAARVFGLNRIRFYENGITGLNLPLGPHALGGRASRTTHPKALAGLAELLTLLFGEKFAVETPFRWKTKGEVLREIKAAGHGSLCALTSSCVHTRELTREHTHCGVCSQCVDRRLSALAAGLTDDEDPPGRYARDVLTGPRDAADLAVIERYLGTALRLERVATADQFAEMYPEIWRVVCHLGMTAQQAAEALFDLHRRHAADVCATLAAEVGRASVEIVRRSLPSNCLLSLAHGGWSGARPPEPSGDANGVHGPAAAKIVVDETSFEVRVGGCRPCFLGNTKEFWLLQRLNRRPGRFVTYDALRQDVWQDVQVANYTIQRTVSNLRRRLHAQGLDCVHIDGETKGNYRLQFLPEKLAKKPPT